jgi:lysophospholipase L1-like esterase
MKHEHDLPWRTKLLFSGTALLALAVIGAVVLAAGEAAVRALAPRSDPVKLGVRLEGSERRHGLKPNLRAVQTGVLVETNSLGFREREYPLERVPGVRRISVLGDSFTFGVGVEFSEIFAKRLEERLNRERGPHEVINFGVSGYNTSMELATLREIAGRFRPDLVILGYVLNDTERVGPAAEAAPAAGSRSALSAAHTWMKDASMLYRLMAPKLGAALGVLFDARYAVGVTHQIIRSFEDDSPGWLESRQALAAIAEETRAMGAGLLVVVFPMMIDFASYPLEDAHRRIVRFCEANGIEVLDLLPRFRGERAGELAVFLDGHPNARAHAIFAEEIFRRLQPGRAPGSAAGAAGTGARSRRRCGSRTPPPSPR